MILKFQHHSGRPLYVQSEFVWTVEIQPDGDAVITPAWGGTPLSVKTPPAEVLAELGYHEPPPPALEHHVEEMPVAQSPLGTVLPVSEPPSEPEYNPNDPEIIPPRRRK